MADKMMRIAGRDSAGLAKNINIDDNGRLITSVSGNIDRVIANAVLAAKSGETNGSLTSAVVWLGTEEVVLYETSSTPLGFSLVNFPVKVEYYTKNGATLLNTYVFTEGEQLSLGNFMFRFTPKYPWGKIVIENATAAARYFYVDLIRPQNTVVSVKSQAPVSIEGETPSGTAKSIHTDIDGVLETRVRDNYQQRIQKIVDLVGLNNLSMFMTFRDSTWPVYDLFDKSIGMTQLSARYSRVIGGPLGYYISRKGVVASTPVSLYSTQGFQSGNADPAFSLKYATYIPKSEGHIGSVSIKIKNVGDVTKKFKVTLYTDDSGKPGVPVPQYNKLFIDGRVDPVYDDSVFKLDANEYHDVPMPLLTGFGLSSYKDKWLVFEYDDETGIDASNYVKWQYGPKTGGKIASHDGTDWVVTDDSSFVHQLFSENIQVPEDFTVCLLVRTTEEKSLAGEQPIISFNGAGQRVFFLSNSYGVLNARWVDENGASSAHNYKPHSPLRPWSVIAATFSKYRMDANGKVLLYHNGQILEGYQEDVNPSGTKVRKGVNGAGGASLLRFGQLNVGMTVYPNGISPSTSLVDIGPFFVAKRKLSPEEIAQVSSLMIGDYNKLED